MNKLFYSIHQSAINGAIFVVVGAFTGRVRKTAFLLVLTLIFISKLYSGTPIVDNAKYLQNMSGDYSADVIIKYGNVVRATGLIKFGTGVKVIVEHGGLLIIENATFTGM